MRCFCKKSKILERGFTLVEIMVVVFILGLLTAIAVPNFMRMRLNANEDIVRADLRAFSTANESYRSNRSPPTYAADIQTLVDQNYLDGAWLAPGERHGYDFVYAVGGNGMMYSMEAVVMTPNVTGINYYCVDQTGVLVSGAATGLGTATGCEGGNAVGG